MKTVMVTHQLHSELKLEAQRTGKSLGDVIGQIRLERERLRELAINLQDLVPNGRFSVVSDATNEVIVLACVRRDSLDKYN